MIVSRKQDPKANYPESGFNNNSPVFTQGQYLVINMSEFLIKFIRLKPNVQLYLFKYNKPIMRKSNGNKCEICGKTFTEGQLIAGHGIRHEIERLIVKDHPEWTDNNMICQDDFNKYRLKYISGLIEDEKGSVEVLQKEVVTSILQNELISVDTNTSDIPLKIGDRISDKVAEFGGSWKFIISFSAMLVIWIIVNSLIILLAKPFDPYPFILLNLILSCVAAMQAPIIMMSQNRQEKKDRIRSENDYKINLKSEIEIRTLHEKVDHLLLDQWSKMMRIQEIQIEVLEEIRNRVEKK